MELRRARRGDLAGILALLRASGLVVDGVAARWPRFRVVVEPDSQAVRGVAGLELHGRVAVVRSVAVDPGLRGLGHGARLVRAVIADAVREGAAELYLTTSGSESFYRRLGFEPVGERDYRPAALRVPAFRRACARGSTPMMLRAGELRPARPLLLAA
jgi:N-acetylglutamate synthase-like GNAT family acetyltransferase